MPGHEIKTTLSLLPPLKKKKKTQVLLDLMLIEQAIY